MAEDKRLVPQGEVEDGLSQEDLVRAQKRLSELSRGDGSVVTMTKQDMGLLIGLSKAILDNAKKDYRNILLTADFDDVNEAKDHHAAFYEEKRYFMDDDDSYILDLIIMECAVNKNRKGDNRVSNILNVLRHKQDVTYKPGGKNGARSSRSPIDEG